MLGRSPLPLLVQALEPRVAAAAQPVEETPAQHRARLDAAVAKAVFAGDLPAAIQLLDAALPNPHFSGYRADLTAARELLAELHALPDEHMRGFAAKIAQADASSKSRKGKYGGKGKRRQRRGP